MTRWWRARPLRVQLVIVVVVLAAIALALSGAIAAAALRGYLLDQVDRQLTQFGGLPRQPHREPDADQDGRGPGFPTELYSQYSDGAAIEVLSRPLGNATPQIPAMSATQAQALGGQPFTVAGSDGSEWRVVVRPYADGSVAVARSLADVQATVWRLAMLEAGVGIVVLAVLVVVATIAVRGSLRPLVEVERTATAIAGGDLSRRVPDAAPGTEVGQLSVAVNAMLDEIGAGIHERDLALSESRASEARMRQFVADASHELRTPLTSIRGYAELYRQGAIPADDVAPTFARLEGESDRMAALVDDLLLLARLDQQRPLERRSVDLLAVASDVVASARAARPDRTVRLVATGETAPIVVGDGSRLRQVIDNLVANALAYGGTGGVDVTVTTRHGLAVVSVADHGPGIPESDKARVFERFYRGQASRSRHQGGSGLGLSIVAAIVAAHSGSVAVRDNDGGGAVFDVSLPLE